MIYNEIYGDLFEVDEKYYLCHCISSDFALGKGIAVEFVKRFNMKSELNRLYEANGNFPVCLRVGKVFNLVTKEKYWHKPTYKTMQIALEDMKKQAVELDIKYLAMPLIGAGLDRLTWDKVSAMIKEIFYNTDIKILVVKR